MKIMLMVCTLKKRSLILVLLASIYLLKMPTSAASDDFSGLLKGLDAIQQSPAQQQFALEVRPLTESEKAQIKRQERIANELKATKIAPLSSSWKKIHNEGGINFYYDPALIRQNGLVVIVPYLVDLPYPNEINLLTEGRYPYKSVISVIQYDCSRRSLPPRSERFWATEDHFFYSENMANGDPMMDPLRQIEITWIEGMAGTGIGYEEGRRIVNQSYFVVKVLNPELKICQNFWKRPDGWEPPKTPPYIQKKPAPVCQGSDMWKWDSCRTSTNKSRPNPHNGTDLIFKIPGRYEGPVTYGSPNGWGIYTFEGGSRAGDVYIGFFSSGNFDGFGTYYHNAPNSLKGSKYIGYFRQNLKHGLGSYINADGRSTEEGLWKEDVLYRPQQLNTFFIDTRNDLPICTGDDATLWTDCFGYLEFESIQGQSLQRPLYSTYAGSFKNGVPDGLGSFFDKNKYLDYQGGLKQGVYEGHGTEFWSLNGESFYTGEYVGGKKQGKGVSQSSRNLVERYEGHFNNGVMVKGTVYKEKQFTYVGSLKGGRFHGEGTYTPAKIPGGGEPIVQEGFWENGRLVKPNKNSSKK